MTQSWIGEYIRTSPENSSGQICEPVGDSFYRWRSVLKSLRQGVLIPKDIPAKCIHQISNGDDDELRFWVEEEVIHSSGRPSFVSSTELFTPSLSPGSEIAHHEIACVHCEQSHERVRADRIYDCEARTTAVQL
jgi:hypothetical protein